MDDKSNQIISLRDSARQQLAQIKDLDEGKGYLDKMKALEAYAKATKQDAEMVMMIQEQKIRSMRILGELLKETDFDNQGGDRRSEQYKTRLPNETVKPMLSDFGISKKESHTYQTIAAIPDEEFDSQINELKQTDSTVKEITVSRFANIGKHYKRQEKINEAAQNKWPQYEQDLKQKVLNGESVVININKHFHLLKWAQESNLYERVDRFTEWGNPFVLNDDGNRDEVCDAYEQHYFPFKKSLHLKVKNLKGKVLGCHCAPARCHGHFLANIVNKSK